MLKNHTISFVARCARTVACLSCVLVAVMPGFVRAAVDVNRANVEELSQVKGIGEKTAKRIVVERARGRFESLEHLSERLSGIGPRTVIKLRDAGLCAGTPDQPCAKPQTVSQADASPHYREPADANAVTPEILRLP